MRMDLVFCSLESWDDVWRRNQYLVAGLLEADSDLRVLFVEPPADPLFDIAARRRPRLGRRLSARPEVAAGRLWTYQPTKWLPRVVGALADDRLTVGLRRTVAGLGFQHPTLWVNDPTRAVLLRHVEWPVVYDVTDDWLKADRPVREIARLRSFEDLLMARCFAVIVCSSELAARKGRIRPVELVPNAVDLARYREPAQRPRDLPAGPVALYAGTLHEDRLDMDLCLRTARGVEGIGRLVFVGPDALSSANSSRLRSARGVVELGARPRGEIPAYLQHADVLIVPHVRTSFTESLDPIKLYEYLAVGRPIVSTPVAGFRTATGPITLASGDSFVNAVCAALVGPHRATTPAPQIPLWSERVAQVQSILRHANG